MVLHRNKLVARHKTLVRIYLLMRVPWVAGNICNLFVELSLPHLVAVETDLVAFEIDLFFSGEIDLLVFQVHMKLARHRALQTPQSASAWETLLTAMRDAWLDHVFAVYW